MEYWIMIVPCFIYGLSKAISDASFFELPNQWVNKYAKDPESGLLIEAPKKGYYGWYHRVNGLKYRERFYLSATALVFVTDPWHFWQQIMIWTVRLTALYAATFIAAFQWWWVLVVMVAMMIPFKLLLNRARRWFSDRV